MSLNKIIPNIWFNTSDGSIISVLKYYKAIFVDDFSIGQIIPLGETPSGYAEICETQLFGQKYSFMSTSVEHQSLNDAISFIVNCENQEEIDRYWNYFTADGEESQCGWCVDKFGLRWQVLPENLGELMSMPNANEIMMSQRKIVIEEYKV